MSIVFDAHASGNWGTGEPLAVEAQASLARMPPEEVTFSDVELLDVFEELRGFELVGSEYVRTEDAETSIATRSPPGSGFAEGECEYKVPHTATLFVAAENVTSHGFRGVMLQSGRVCCFHCDVVGQEGCAPGARRECYP